VFLHWHFGQGGFDCGWNVVDMTGDL
jgi:hypothetical protein